MTRRIDWGNHAVELVLVVVGILAALAIDDWRHERQARQQEFQLLGQLHQDLTRDLEAIRQTMKDRANVVAAMATLRTMVEGAPLDEGTFSTAMARTATLERFAFRRGAYAIIKSGTASLSDDELRILLSDYYEYSTVLANQSIADIEHSFLSFWLPFVKEYARDWRYDQHYYAQDPQAMLADPNFRQLLITEVDNNLALIRKLEPLSEQMVELLAKIEAKRESLSRSP